MLITDKNKLKDYTSENRLWQGIPGIEVTKNGRIFVCFYSGGVGEQTNNYVCVLKSDDGENFTEPVLVAIKENYRCYDPCLWIDPLGRLWLFWAVSPEHAVYASVCENPDADELVWSKEFVVGNDVMMNKPTVLSTGEWLFPIAVWKKGIFVEFKTQSEKEGSFAYRSIDNGKTFENIGCADIRDRVFDEHMILELNDGRLAMYVRTRYGIGVSYSYDRGKTWTDGEDSGYGGPNSRFFIRRLKSGRILLVNHFGYEYDSENVSGRSHLTAMLSEDDGKTWKYKLLLDERNNVSYPDGIESADGYIYITYDRERASFAKSLDHAYLQAREILFAKFTEEDIVAGKIISEKGRLKQVVSKLGKYSKEKDNPYGEFERYSSNQLAEKLSDKPSNEVIAALFNHYQINCTNMHKIDSEKLDELIVKLEEGNSDNQKIICGIITLIRSVSTKDETAAPIIERIKNVLKDTLSDEISVKDIADKVGISQYYMCHLFKKITGITITDYRNELKILKAKDMLVNSDESLTNIAQKCGFGSSSYFSKIFTRSEKISPSRYRQFLKRQS